LSLKVPKVEVADGVEQFDELLVAARHRRAELRAVDVKVVEEPLEVTLAVRADGRGLDIPRRPGERLVEIRVVGRARRRTLVKSSLGRM
jgi:hypothetical protein